MSSHAVDELKRSKPHHLLVALEDGGEARRVAIPNVRNRWERVARVLDGLRWVSAEARSADGGVLAVVAASEDLPDRYPSVVRDALAAGRVDVQEVQIRERDLLEILDRSNDRAVQRALEAQASGTQRYEALVSVMFEGVRQILDVLNASTRAVAASYTQALHLSASSSTSTSSTGEEGLAALTPLLATLSTLATPRPHAQRQAQRPKAVK